MRFVSPFAVVIVFLSSDSPSPIRDSEMAPPTSSLLVFLLTLTHLHLTTHALPQASTLGPVIPMVNGTLPSTVAAYSDGTLEWGCDGSVSPNCCGSLNCWNVAHDQLIDSFTGKIEMADETEGWLPDSNIACITIDLVYDYCLFAKLAGPQTKFPPNGIYKEDILPRLKELKQRGCNGCGSVSIDARDIFETEGKLISNNVGSTPCKGLCPANVHRQTPSGGIEPAVQALPTAVVAPSQDTTE